MIWYVQYIYFFHFKVCIQSRSKAASHEVAKLYNQSGPKIKTKHDDFAELLVSEDFVRSSATRKDFFFKLASKAKTLHLQYSIHSIRFDCFD